MYTHIAVGGTFDGMHKGHRHFLTNAFESGRHVTIGLTSQMYIRKYKRGKGVSPYSRRYQVLTTWLRSQGLSSRVTIVPLHDSYGPTLLAEGFDAIVVTRDNKHVGHEINKRREKRGLPPLVVVEIDLIAAKDTRPISSTRIRKGEIDESGTLVLPDNLRPELQKPLGAVLADGEIETSVRKNRDTITISVGDIATQTLFSFGVQPSLAIIDLYVQRKPYQSFEAYKFPKKYHIVRVKSGPGFIAKRAVRMIRQWSKDVKKRTVIVVNGEEDLLAIPAIIHAPVGSILYYGQPGQGLVEVVVSKEKKNEVGTLLTRFL